MMDVAAKSGFSHQTVSRVLNNHKSVSASTREKVLRVMNELGYTPNLAARALVTDKTWTIGLLSYDTTLFGPASTLHAVQMAAREKGYKTTIVSLKSQDFNSLLDGINELKSVAVDGAIIIAPFLTGAMDLKDSFKNFPVVLVEGEAGMSIPSVNVDQMAGAFQITQHLVDLGHTDIAHISGPEQWYESKTRLKGWKKALTKNILSTKHLYRGDWSAKSGYEAAKNILRKKEITAIFAGNDAMALGALKALLESKVSVPEKMSLVGFDDIPESPYFSPALTTVRQDFEAVGIKAFDLLMQVISDQAGSIKNEVVSPTVILRQSTSRRRL